MTVKAIHSGGQTGADQGGLAAAVILGLDTGGVAPKGYRTQAGNATWLKKLGVKEHASFYYWPRTKDNVENTDGTLIFGNVSSKGSALTKKYIGELNKHGFVVAWKTGDPTPNVEAFRDWINEHGIETLNVAGNREESMPGIFEAVKEFLVEALTDN